MNRPLMFAIATFLLLVGISLAGKPDPVMAGHGCHGCYRFAWYGGSCAGCAGSYCWRGCSGCYSCSGCSGYTVRRYYSYSRCWACSGCQGPAVVYRYGGCDCGGWADCGGCHAAPAAEPKETAPPPKSLKPAASQPTAEAGSEDGQIFISLQCPADAKVFINGYPTQSTGAERRYVSRVPESEQTYGYEVKAEVVRDGTTLVQTETARLRR